MSQNVKYVHMLGYLGGPEGVFNDITGAYLAFQLSSQPYLCTCQIRKQSDKNFLSLNPKYENKYMSNPGQRKLQGTKTSSQSRHMHNKENNNYQFSYMGHNIQKKIIFWLFGGAWVAHK